MKKRQPKNILLPLIAYGVSLFLLYLQLPFWAVTSMPLQGQLLLTDFMKSPPAVWAIIQFATAVIVLQLAPVWLILTLYKHDPQITQYSTKRTFFVGITYVLLWHLVIAIFNAQVTPHSDWALIVRYNSNSHLNFILVAGSSALFLAMTARALWNHFDLRKLIAFTCAVSLLMLLFNSGGSTVLATTNHEKPNIFLIGVDSLSYRQYQDYKEQLPNIRKLEKQSVIFSDTVTPLGRTFAAWTSILSGKYPRETGARDNLFPLDQIDSSNFLPNKLKAAGYTTIFSMDERQFCNIDESWGFDKVIGPDVGAPDFVLSAIADIPMVNIVVTSWPSLGNLLFPYITYNRAAWKQYYPERFSNELTDKLSEISASPMFLAVHFVMAHSPYRSAAIYPKKNNLPKSATQEPNHFYDGGHFNAIAAADRQVGELIETLRRTGRLENAVVVLLSDHGEGLGYWSRTFKAESYVPYQGGTAHSLQHLEFIFGHGSNLNEPDMNQSLLMVSRYINGKPTNPSSTQTTPTALVDIFPTVLELSGIKFNANDISGISLASAIQGTKYELTSRWRFLESGISPPALNSRDPDHNALLVDMSDFFEISPSGKVEIREQDYGYVIETKKRAVIHGNWQLTVYPAENPMGYQLLLFNRENGRWTDSPDSPLWQEANGDRLAEAMVRFFGIEEMPKGAWLNYLSASMAMVH